MLCMGETGVRSAGFIKVEKPALVTPVLKFLQIGETVVGGAGFEILKKRRNRRWECRFQMF